MELSFTGGRFVSNRGELNYKEVLEHFPNASIIRIITINEQIPKSAQNS